MHRLRRRQRTFPYNRQSPFNHSSSTVRILSTTFSVKVCGVRDAATIDTLAHCGVDAVGLNFFPPSVRFIDPTGDAVRAIVRRAAERSVQTVGVFVDQTVDQTAAIAHDLNLDIVQLHGDQTVDFAQRLRDQFASSILRAIKLPRTDLRAELIADATEAWSTVVDGVLLDADAGPMHGGSGKTLDWDAVGRWNRTTRMRWTLAGGLTPLNVAEAIVASGAASVDVAGGVEHPRGVKHADRIAAFATASRLAFQRRARTIVDRADDSGSPNHPPVPPEKRHRSEHC